MNFLLQASVVVLGFGMNLKHIERAGRSGFVYTAVSIVVASCYVLDSVISCRLRENRRSLISAGTAICGGSAIAAVGPIAGVNEQEMAVSLGAAFILKFCCPVTFPSDRIAGALHSWGGFKLTD